jgi:hypothetical protein
MPIITESQIGKTVEVSFGGIVYGLLPAALAAVALLTGRDYMLVLLALPALVAVLLWFPVSVLLITTLTVMFVEGLYYNLGLVPRQVTWLSDVAIILFAARVFLFSKFKLFDALDPFRVPILLFLAVFLCSALLNWVRPAVVLVSFRQYFKYIILYVAIISLPLSLKEVSRSLRWFFYLILIQVPIIIICYELGIRGDSLAGGLGSAGGTATMGLLCGAAASLYMSFYIFEGKLLDVLKLISMAIVPAISEIKFGIMMFPVVVLSTLLLPLWERRRRVLPAVVMVVVLTVVGIKVYRTIYPHGYIEVQSLSGLQAYAKGSYKVNRENMYGYLYLGRLARIQVATAFVVNNPSIAFLGLGPGEISNSFFEAANGSYSRTILADTSDTQCTLVLLELGCLGLALSGWIMVRLIRGLIALYRATTVSKEKAFVCGLIGASLTCIPYAFYMNVMFVNDAACCLFWLFAAYLTLSTRTARESSSSEGSRLSTGS